METQAFDGSWKNVCENVRGGCPGEKSANLSLIEAAPDLLFALKKAAPAVEELHAQGYGCPDCRRDNPDGSPSCALMDEIYLALEKAEPRAEPEPK